MGTLKYYPEFREILKERMKKEPEVLRKFPSTGSVTVDYNYFLNKKAELEAARIIDELLKSEPSSQGGYSE